MSVMSGRLLEHADLDADEDCSGEPECWWCGCAINAGWLDDDENIAAAIPCDDRLDSLKSAVDARDGSIFCGIHKEGLAALSWWSNAGELDDLSGHAPDCAAWREMSIHSSNSAAVSAMFADDYSLSAIGVNARRDAQRYKEVETGCAIHPASIAARLRRFTCENMQRV